MHKVSIKNEIDGQPFPTHVFIDEKSIKAMRVSFSQSVDAFPSCEIEFPALPDIEVLADIRFQFTPKTTQEAAKVLRHNLMVDKSLYNAFVASIKSALMDLPEETYLKDASELIVNRIIGEE